MRGCGSRPSASPRLRGSTPGAERKRIHPRPAHPGPMPPVPVAAPGERPQSPCVTHGCSECCHETEMLLSEADLARLEGLGNARDAFSFVDGDGFAVLRNVDGPEGERPRCFFLKEGQCSVYEHRPEGCRSYPIILNERRRAIRDEDCPHRSEFPRPPATQRRLMALYQRIEREAQARR